MLARGSLRFVVPPLIAGILFLFAFSYISPLLFGIGLYMAWFFRDPHREIQYDSSILYAAADGTVKEVLSDTTLKIAIRMSPFDVHLNRAPISGEISSIQYKPGTHHSVYFAGAEEKNEQNLISLECDGLAVDILQVTGAFARRIESWVDVGQQVQQGDKIGMIRFGSQTNVLIKPKESEEITVVPAVTVGQSVRAGITPIAEVRRLAK